MPSSNLAVNLVVAAGQAGPEIDHLMDVAISQAFKRIGIENSTSNRCECKKLLLKVISEVNQEEIDESGNE